MPDETKYSQLRSRVVSALRTPAAIPLKFDTVGDAFAVKQIEEAALTGLLFTTILDFADRISVSQKLEQIVNPETKQLSLSLKGDVSFITLLITKGIVDSAGLPVLSVEDVTHLSGKYSDLVFALCWQVLYANDFFTVSQQDTVGNSEGTENSTNS